MADVGVAVCRGNARMAQHLLDDTQICAIFKKVGCKRVAQRVRRNRARDSRLLGIAFHSIPNGDAIDPLASSREKEGI